MNGHKNGARYKRLVSVGQSPDDCWQWTGSVNKTTGYGKKQWHGESWLAHRWVWTMLFGSIPKDLAVDHMCGNRRCVNPLHLQLVTQAENIRRGNGTTLTAEHVREIRALNIKRGQQAEIAARYGVSPATISDVRNGKSWATVPF